MKIGDKYKIHCYKHNGKLHRQWDEAVVLDIKDDYIVFAVKLICLYHLLVYSPVKNLVICAFTK